MANLEWQLVRNLENSLQTFLDSEISSQSLTIIDQDGNSKSIQARVGWKVSDDWELPVISVYVDDRTLPRSFIGNNIRLKSYLMIIDIRSLDEGSRMDIATWVENTINDGFNFYEFDPNPADPMNPLQVQQGFVSVDFVTSTPVRLGQNVDLLDKYRHSISITCTISGDC